MNKTLKKHGLVVDLYTDGGQVHGDVTAGNGRWFASIACAVDTGELQCANGVSEPRQLTVAQQDWLISIEESI